MSDELFDLGRLRKKWVAEPDASAPRLVPRGGAARVADVEAPFDVAQAAKEIVTRLRATLILRFPEQRRAIEHFLDRAEDAFTSGAVTGEGGLEDTLDRLEDLIEALLVARRARGSVAKEAG